MDNKFKWIEITNKIAKKIVKYKNSDEQLMQIIQNVKEEMGKNIETRDKERINSIDGFSAINIIVVRPSSDNTKDKSIITFFEKLGEKIEIPKGKYNGIPSLNYTKTRITNGKKDEYNLKKALWNLFDICLRYADNPNNINEKEFINYYNNAINEHIKINSKLSKHFIKALTVSMFLCCPNVYVPLDVNSLKELNKIMKARYTEELFKEGENYVNLIKEVKKYINDHNENYKTIYELSDYAYQTNREEKMSIYFAGSETIENRKRFYKNQYYTINWGEMGNLKKYNNNKTELEKTAKELFDKKTRDLKEAIGNFMNLKKGDILILKTQLLVPETRGGKIHAIGVVTESFNDGYNYINNMWHSIPVKWIKIYEEPIVEDVIFLDRTLKKLNDDDKEKMYSILGDIDMDNLVKQSDLVSFTSSKTINYDKNIILYGPPGTGKTYSSIIYAVAICNKKSIEEVENEAKEKAKSLEKDYYDIIKEEFDRLQEKNRITFITFHQSYSYEDFIEGIKPILQKNKQDSSKNEEKTNEIKYKIEDGILKNICQNINKENEPENYVLIIDEINRGNISKIFGELITLLEEDKRKGEKESLSVVLPYSKIEFSIPNNLYVLGTMNTADRSIALMDTALRRRFSFIEMLPDSTKLNNKQIIINGENIDLEKMLDTMNKRIEILYDREHTIGHAFFMEISKNNNPTIEDLKNVFKKKIIPLLQEYFYDDYSKIKLVLENDFIINNQENSTNLFDQDILNETNIQIDGLIENQYIINDEAFEDILNYKKIYE